MAETVRELRWWELSTIAEADARIFGESAWTHAYYWAVMAQPGTRMFVALDGGDGELTADALAAWIVMSASGTDADVMTIARTEGARGRGLGARMLETGIDWARARGTRTIHLEVDAANASAIALYSSFGFIEWGRRPDYYPGGDAVLMKLVLD